MRDKIKLKDLDNRIVLRIQEESLPENSLPSLMRFIRILLEIYWSMILESHIRIYMMDPIYYLEFIHDEYSALEIDLEREIRMIKGNRDSPIGFVREILDLNSDISGSGICCRRHFKDVNPGIFIPFDAPLIQIASAMPGRQVNTNSA